MKWLYIPLSTLALAGCDVLAGGTCQSDYACIAFDESVGNGKASKTCGFITNDLSNGDIGVTTNFNALVRECPEDAAYVFECPFEENVYGAVGVIYYKADAWTEEGAEASCEWLAGSETTVYTSFE